MVNKYGFKILLMKWNSHLLLYIVVVLLMIGCDKSDDDTLSRTVLVYMAADNDLADNALRNIEQMKSSFPINGENNCLLIFRKKNLI